MRIFLALSLTLIKLLGFGQDIEGVVTYESVIKIDVSRFPPEIVGRIPSEQKSKNQLFFTETETLYKKVKEEEDINKEVSAGGRKRMEVRMRGAGDREVYTNLEDGSVVDKSDLFGRTFLIEGSEPIEWKMTSEMRMIAGYQCMKATYMRDTIPVSAWFTPQISISVGPDSYAGLPGLVLSIQDGPRVITAINVDIRLLTEEEAIVAPEKGKKVTREEFRKIRREKMEEMREMNGGRGGNGTFIIRN